MKKTALLLFCAGFLLLGFSTSAFAATYYWVGGTTNSNTSNTANWNTSAGSCADSANVTAPTTGDTINFVSNCVNNATVDSALSVNTFIMNTGYTGTVTNSISLTVTSGFTVNAGTFNVTNGGTISNNEGSIGNAVNSSGIVNVSGVGSSWTNSGLLYVGRVASGTGTLNIQNGGTVSATGIRYGHVTGATGVGIIDGVGSALTSSSLFVVGRTGIGTLTVQYGATINVASGIGTVTVAQNAGSIGTLNIGTGYTTDVISAASIVAGLGTATFPPMATTTPAVTATSSTSISWDWSDETGATGYKVYRASDNTLLTTISSATSNWTQDSLSANTAYSVYYRGTNTNGEGAASANATSVYTLASQVTALSATNTTDKSSYQIDLTWTDQGQTGMKIEEDSGCDGYDTTLYDNATTDATAPYSVTVSANTCYAFRISSYNHNGTINSSSIPETSQITSPPTEPTSLTNTATSGTSVTWDWADVTSATGYKVYRTSDDTLLTTISSATSNWTQTPLASNTSYSIYVRATNLNGEGIASSNASAYTSADSPTNAGHSTITTSSIKWTWSPGAGQKDNYASTTTPVANSGWITDSFWNQTALSSNTSYTVSIKARNQNNNETGSISTSAYTLAPTPTNLSASLNSNNITLTVDSFLNDTSGQSGYYFSRSGANSGWIQTNSWTDTGLSCGNSYDYSVKYRNGDGTETDPISITESTNRCPSSGGYYRPPVIVQPSVLNSPSSVVSPANTPVVQPSTPNIPRCSISKYNVLGIGWYGDEVKCLQEILNLSTNPKLFVDGIFGPKTKQAVIDFQKVHELVPDGIVGPKTKTKINIGV